MATICVDLDGVLIGLKAVDLASNFKHSEVDIIDYGLQCFSEDLRQLIFSHFHNPETMCRNVKVLEGVVETLSRWKSLGHQIFIVTARSEVIRKETVEMVNSLFPMVDGIRFVNIDESKNGVLRELGCDLFIDDAPHNLEAARGEFLVVMISNKYTKYNHHLLGLPTYKAIKDIPESTLKVAQIHRLQRDSR